MDGQAIGIAVLVVARTVVVVEAVELAELVVVMIEPDAAGSAEQAANATSPRTIESRVAMEAIVPGEHSISTPFGREIETTTAP